MTQDKAEIAERLRDEFESLWFLYPDETFESPLSGAWERAKQAVDDAVEALAQPAEELDLHARVRQIVTEFVDGPYEFYDTPEGYDAAVASAVEAITALLHSVASAKV
jgi:hypothetical protein